MIAEDFLVGSLEKKQQHKQKRNIFRIWSGHSARFPVNYLQLSVIRKFTCQRGFTPPGA